MDAMVQRAAAGFPEVKYAIVIAGGGASGLTVAAELKRRHPGLDIAIVEPSEIHWYQPGWTLVGAGVFSRRQTERREEKLIPKGVTWIRAAAASFHPEENVVRLSDGRQVRYDFLIACPGLKIDWDAIEGLTDTLGRNGVCSNYRPDTAEYTWQLIKSFRGGTALFSVTDADGNVSDVEKRFDMIHVVPPQTGLDVVSASPLANAAGWIEVDPANLRHVRYPNIFALGDAASTTNAKTAAAVRIQAPIVVANLLAAMKGEPLPKAYDGYGSCPLTVAYGKIVLAEFAYGGKVTPSFPLDPRVPRRSMWLLKTKLLPWLYWSHMFKGGEFDIPHRAVGWLTGPGV